MPPRNYTRGDRAALILFGQGKCYWGPGCTEPLLMKVENRYRLNLQIAHIRSDEQAAQRYVPDISREQVDAFENLLFLCKPHHDTIDEHGAAHRFTIEILEGWKLEREQGHYEELRGLRDITEDGLVERITSALEERNHDIRTTLARLERTDAEAAALIRELLDETKALRRAGSILDPDTVWMLGIAARDLEHLEGSASKLSSVAGDLTHLESSARTLAEAVSNAGRLSDVAIRLNNAIDRAEGCR
ncbi:hypothetical protein [Amycolatopsis magusensis]|uniref:hypothetical protein n=1 Tax=Amycolatopsis magusensis TaxID=882444 RepID=UPI0024A912DE|nr:hypothetical protein [Amycolatopsis magusensis]MDI5975486.1 hypothetical protein [Amycolatopsis magusensis]